MKTLIITECGCYDSNNGNWVSCQFDKRVNEATALGWEIIPESMKIDVKQMSNWAGCATNTVLSVILKKD